MLYESYMTHSYCTWEMYSLYRRVFICIGFGGWHVYINLYLTGVCI